jgi:hypothetical protein
MNYNLFHLATFFCGPPTLNLAEFLSSGSETKHWEEQADMTLHWHVTLYDFQQLIM